VLRIAGLEGEEFARAIAFFGGLPPEVLADADLRELLLPAVIGDFRMAVGYRYLDRGPLPVPITLVNGREDPHVGPEQLAPWDAEAAAAPERHWAEGGHFYFEQRPEAVTGLLRAIVQADQHIEMI
jgi:medium-chain acyl-[acyl-carrier-protein] hydrolase